MDPTASRRPTTVRRTTAARATTARRTTTGARGTRTAIITTSTSGAVTPTETAAPGSGGLSGGAIGGIVAGVVMVFALVGLVFYKKRKRAMDAKAKDTPKDEPMYMNPSNYNKGSGSGPPDDNISGPMALTTGPTRTQDHAHQDSRDDRYAHAGAGPHGGYNDRYGPNGQHGYNDVDNGPYRGPGNNGYDGPDNYNGGRPNDYYDDYYGDNRHDPHRAPREDGHATPAPDYYLGKEDIDPKRDIRGMDLPEAYVGDKKSPPLGDRNQVLPTKDSPRNSFSTDGGSTFMTPDQAQKAHQEKMRGHKQSLTMEHPLSPDMHAPMPDSASISMSDSTMSMIPSLPPTNSPSPFTPEGRHHQRHGSDPRMQGRPGPKGSNHGPGYQGDYGYDDQYAESAYGGQDYPDDRSLMSSGYQNSPHQKPYSRNGHPQQHNQYYNQHPPYSQQGYRQGPGYGNGGGRPQQPDRGRPPGGGGYGGPHRHGPGPGHHHGHGPGSGYGSPMMSPMMGRGSPAPGRGPPNYHGHGGGYHPSRVASPAPRHQPHHVPF